MLLLTIRINGPSRMPEEINKMKTIIMTLDPCVKRIYLSNGKSANKIFDPSNGGMGNKLKTPKPMDNTAMDERSDNTNVLSTLALTHP